MSADVECPPLHELYGDKTDHPPIVEPSPGELNTKESLEAVVVVNASPKEEKLEEKSEENHATENGHPALPPVATSQSGDQADLEDVEMIFMHPGVGTPAAAALQANANLKVSKFDKGLRRIKGIKHPKIKKFKRKKEGRKFSRNFKGKTIEGIHEQYTLTIGMMLGIRVAIGGRYNHPDISKNLVVEDFGYVEKIEFPPDGNNKPPHCTPPHALAHTFKFKTYAPKVFSKIRQFFSVDSASYMESVCGDSNYLEFISNSKSGQFFFYSHDGRYMIKTQTKEENKFMKRILPHYYKYMSENPSTLLVKIFGMHRVKMYHLNRKIHFVIMASVFDTTEVIHQIYDLKGSLIGRSATEAERANGGVLKDNDLVNDGVKFHLGNKKPSFIQQLRRDAEFLATLNIMDYSLLVGIHDREKRTSTAKRMSIAGVPGDDIRSQTPFRSSIVGKTAEHQAFMDSLRGELENSIVSAAGSPSRRSPKRNSLTSPSPDKAARRRRASSADTGKHHHHHHHHVHPPHQHSEMSLSMEKPEIGGRQVRSSSTSDAAGVIAGPEPEHVDSDDEEDYDSYDDEDEHDDEGDSDPEETPEQRHERQVRFRERLSAESPYSILSDPSTPVVGSKPLGKMSPGKRPLSQSLAHGLSKLSSILDDGTNESSAVRGSVTREFEVMPTEAERISRVFRDQATLTELSHVVAGERPDSAVYGPGASTKHPWTTRVDNGINCRDPVTNQRGKLIYFVGIIDILQQYNTFKRVETIYKGLFNDRKQISSVPAKDYADRFVKFFEDNVD